MEGLRSSKGWARRLHNIIKHDQAALGDECSELANLVHVRRREVVGGVTVAE
jgi:hypothetical protein